MLEVERTGQHVAEAYRFAGNPGDTSRRKTKMYRFAHPYFTHSRR